MFTNFQYWGEWFLPEFPDNKVVGIIKGDTKDGIYLEIFGKLLPDQIRHRFSVTNEKIFSDLIIILGEIEKGIKVTLYSNAVRSTQILTLKPVEKFWVKYFFQNEHFFTYGDLKFDRYQISYDGLAEFINQSGINTNNRIREKKFSIEFIPPSPVEIQFDPTLKVTVRVLPKFSIDKRKLSIESDGYFEIESSIELGFDTILDYSKRIQLFMTFTANQKVFPASCNLLCRGKDSIIKLMFIPRFFDNKPLNYLFSDFRFRLTEAQTEFPELLRNWFTKYEALKIAFDILEEAIYGQHTNDTRFLHLVRAIESYHRLTHPVSESKIESYSNNLKEIKMKLGGKDRTWMKKHNCINKYGYEPNLSKRIKDIIEETGSKNIVDIIKSLNNEWNKPSKFADEVAKKRNKMTHPEEKVDSVIQDGLLIDTNKLLEFILIAHTYVEIGIDPEQVNRMFEKFLHKNIS